MSKTILALDVATVTGWAFGCTAGANSRPSSSGALRFAEPGAYEARVWAKAMVWLIGQINELRPDIVVIEAPIRTASAAGGSNANTFVLLNGLQAVLRSVVELKMPVSAKLAHVQTVRKFVIGHGNLPGKEAKRRVKDRMLALGWATDQSTYDECDAMAVWAKAAADVDRVFAANFTPLSTHRPKAVQTAEPMEF